MSTIISAPFENGLTGGLAYDSLTHSESITQDTTQFRHGATSMKITGNAANSIYGLKTVSTSVLTRSFYFRFPALPASNCLITRGLGPAQVPGITLNVNGKLQSHIGSTDSATSPSTVLSPDTWYLLDYRFDTSGTTYTVDFQISDTNGSVLSTATQLTLSGQTGAIMTGANAGQCASVALTIFIDDDEATDQSGDYPIGPHTSNDGTFPPITSYPPSWIDDPTRIGGGVLFGMMTQNTGSGDNGQAALAEGATKANRPVYIVQTFYSNVQTVGTLTFEHQIQNGSLLGHQGWTMVHPFGFGSTTVNWPVAGLAAFSNGSQDAYLDLWVTVMNAQLGASPFLIRPFREMTNNATIYGRNGAANGGINETTATFIAAWRYIYTYLRTRVPTIRFVWCPDTNTAPSDTVQWYPGNDYVDWIGVDAYGVIGNGYNPAPALTAHHDAYKTGGTLGLAKPLMICETSIQKTDANRIADFQAYTSLLTTLNQYKAVNIWDSASAGPYYISDSPTGFLSAFQTVVGSPPFNSLLPLVGPYESGVLSVSSSSAVSVSAADILKDSGILGVSGLAGITTTMAGGANPERPNADGVYLRNFPRHRNLGLKRIR